MKVKRRVNTQINEPQQQQVEAGRPTSAAWSFDLSYHLLNGLNVSILCTHTHAHGGERCVFSQLILGSQSLPKPVKDA